ncbi:MAG: hypothetical protein KGI66_03585 [Patescibacteria group bacterium]|nr:hypothetical protein [Patescibacteria group bacterium]
MQGSHGYPSLTRSKVAHIDCYHKMLALLRRIARILWAIFVSSIALLLVLEEYPMGS